MGANLSERQSLRLLWLWSLVECLAQVIGTGAFLVNGSPQELNDTSPISKQELEQRDSVASGPLPPFQDISRYCSLEFSTKNKGGGWGDILTPGGSVPTTRLQW